MLTITRSINRITGVTQHLVKSFLSFYSGIYLLKSTVMYVLLVISVQYCIICPIKGKKA